MGTQTRLKILALAAALATAACGRTPFPVIQTKMDAEKGEPVKTLYPKLGDPGGSEEVNGEKAYVWTSSAKKTAAGVAGASIGFDCTLRVFVDKNEKVTHYDFKGNVGGCAVLAHRLDDSYDLVHWTSP
jgi:hypothetical protein